MDDEEEFITHKIIADYSNMLADIIMGKNAEKHLPVINESLDALNTIIDSDILDENETTICIKIAYDYYKLKEDAEKLIN